MANVPIYNLTDTWNAGGTTFNAIKMSVTDTASAAGSKLLDLLVGGASKFSVDKAGNVAAAGTLTVTGASTLAALGATNGTFSGTLGVTGASTLAAVGATNITASGTLGVTGATTLAALSATTGAFSGNLAVATDKFTVTAATGNTVVAGTLGVTGLATFSAGIGNCGPGGNLNVAIGTEGNARGAGDIGIGLNACGGSTAAVNYTSGGSNTCVGTWAGRFLTTGSHNTLIGRDAGGGSSAPRLSTGTHNACVGTSAGTGLTTGSYNSFLGTDAGYTVTTGGGNIAVGRVSPDSATASYQLNIGNRYFHNRIELGTNTGANFIPNAGDCILLREAADALAMRNGTNAQTFRLYNTYTDGSNYERGFFAWDTNVLKLGTAKAGSGVARALELQTDGTTAVTLTTGQKAEFAATIKTAAPSGGTAAEWKLGTVASVTPTSPDRTIEVEIGGTTYYLAAKTTND